MLRLVDDVKLVYEKLKIFFKKITYSFPILIAFTRLYFFFISFALRF